MSKRTVTYTVCDRCHHEFEARLENRQYMSFTYMNLIRGGGSGLSLESHWCADCTESFNRWIKSE